MLASDPLYISAEDYLAGELISPIKHEYRDGEVFAMSGGTRAHTFITGNLFALLWMSLRRSGCRAFSENMKVRIPKSKAYYYPDVGVTCRVEDQDRQTKEHMIHHPTLLIEVLSPSTESFDRREKFADYRTLDSLQEYCLVSADRPEIELFRRDTSGNWAQQVYRGSEGGDVLVKFESVGVAIALGEIYEDTGILES